MNNDIRGASVGNGSSLTGGQSIANGPDTPKWVTPEFLWSRAMSTTCWDFME